MIERDPLMVSKFPNKIVFLKNESVRVERMNGQIQLRAKKKDELINAHQSTLEFVNIKKLHEIIKALEKSFQLRPIPLPQLNSFGYSIKKSARGSKTEIAERALFESEAKLTCQLQRYALAKRKELGKWDCAQIKDL